LGKTVFHRSKALSAVPDFAVLLGLNRRLRVLGQHSADHRPVGGREYPSMLPPSSQGSPNRDLSHLRITATGAR